MKMQRKTRQRQMVLGAVRARCDHPSADQIYLDVRALDSRISRGTVYRNLNILAQQGEILQVKVPYKDRFECSEGPHYHLLCTECGRVVDAPLSYFGEIDMQISEETDFIIKRHQIIFEGICQDCQNKQS